MRKIPRLVTILTFSSALALAGCPPPGPTPIDPATLSRFERGRTTFSEVVEALGKPTSSTLRGDGSRQATYHAVKQTVTWQHFMPGARHLAPNHAEHTTVILEFDQRQVLSAYSATQGTLGGPPPTTQP